MGITVTSHEGRGIPKHRKFDGLFSSSFGVMTKETFKFWIILRRHRSSEHSSHKEPVTQKTFPCYETWQLVLQSSWASCQIRKIAGWMLGTFSPPTRVSNPDMQQGTCMTLNVEMPRLKLQTHFAGPMRAIGRDLAIIYDNFRLLHCSPSLANPKQQRTPFTNRG